MLLFFSGVSVDSPIRSSDLAVQRTDRIAREKLSAANSTSNNRVISNTIFVLFLVL